MPERSPDEATAMGYKPPEEVSSEETAASRGRVLDLLRIKIDALKARMGEQADEEQVRTGHELEDLTKLQEAYDKVGARQKAHEVEQTLRDYLPPELMGDVDRLVALNREGKI